MEGYQVIVWFSGDRSDAAGPSSNDATNLAAYLDGGGRLFLDSQDYLYNMGLTPFAQSYLGAGSYVDDAGNATTQYGVAGDPIGDGLGPFPLSYPANFTDYSDIIQPGNGGSVAFRSSAGGGNNLDVDKDGGNWKTVFFATSWVAVAHANTGNGEILLDRILDWFGGCQCLAVDIVAVETAVDACMVSFDPDYTGTPPIGWQWLFPDGDPASSASENPTGINFGLTGAYPYTVTAANCGGVQTDIFSDFVTVECETCQPITAVVLSPIGSPPLYTGIPVDFTADILPATAAPPYTYDVTINDTPVITAQTTVTNPIAFAYTFAEAGVYTVTVSVWNCDLSVPVSQSVTVTILPGSAYKLYLPAVLRP
jgi:hypothetical protein